MKKTVLFAASAALLLAACTEPINEMGEITPEKEKTTDTKTIVLSPEELCLIEQIANKTPKISPETAQETAMQLLGLQNQTSSLSKKMTATIFCNKKQVYNSLTKSYKQEEDTAFYVFNTPDEQGFAIVAADLRVPNQVLAYSDNGSFDPETDNPGMALFLEMAKGYVAERIATAEAQEDSLTESVLRKLGIKVDTKGQNSFTKVKELMRIKCTTVGLPVITIRSQRKVEPLIKTKWYQGYPLNDKCFPEIVGCAPLAIAQILAYWKKPNTLRGYTFDWNVICSGSPYYTYKEQISTLIDVIRKEVYTESNGSTYYAYPLNFFRRIGFSSYAVMKDYNFNDVVNALDQGRPVFIGGTYNNTNEGHAWIADGYLKRYGTKTETFKYCIVEELDDGTITDRYEDIPTSSSFDNEFLSFNWGFGNKGDGYYDKNVFDTYNRMEITDWGEYTGRKTDNLDRVIINTDLKTIIDIYPRN